MEIASDRTAEIKRELVRRNLHMFVSNTVEGFCDSHFYVELCGVLRQFAQDVLDKKSPRLVLSVPPRHLKSQICSVRFPLWLMLMYEMEIIVATYGQELSNTFSNDAKKLLEHPYTQNLFPDIDEKGTIKRWSAGGNSVYFATSAGGAATGLGGHVVIIDDPYKDMDEAYSAAQREKIFNWFQAVAMTRLQPGGGVLVVQTRWHDDDLAGRLSSKGWHSINYPMLGDNDRLLVDGRFTLQQAYEIRDTIGSKVWSALYCGNPLASADAIFKLADLQRYVETDVHFERKICSWDFTFSKTDTSDYVVGSVWGQSGNRYYLVEVFRKRADFQEALALIRTVHSVHPDIQVHLVEDKANGPAIISTLKEQTELVIVPITPTDSKIARALAAAPLWESRRVFAPHMAHWLPDWESEVSRFPAGKHDDQVDSMTQALAYLRSSLRFANLTAEDFEIRPAWENYDDDY